jgi:hypothetical protein
MKKTIEKCCGYGCATVICVAALIVDGISAITMAVAVAAGIAGVAGYAVGAMKKEE